MGRAPCCDKANVKRGPWSPEEDATLKSYIEKFGTGGNWIALPQKIGLKRCGKNSLRWLNYLRPNIRHGGFSEEEDNIICSLYKCIGSRWSIIASRLPGRTDNDVKNHWNTKLKKNVLSKQRNDQHDSAWRAAILMKQEMIKSENEYFMVNSNQCLSHDQSWPMLPTAHISHKNQHHSYPYLDYQPDHQQLHTAIIGSSNTQSSSEFPVAQEQLYNSFINMISSPIPENLITSSNYSYNNEEGLANFDGFCGRARTDFDNFISSSKQGMENELERFCAIDFSKSSTGTSSMESSTIWGDTNSLGYTPFFPDCEVFQQTLSYNFTIDDPLIRFQ